VTGRFDVVLLDCPPLFNTCGVNALAASDYIIVPVVPSKKAAERVPLLLERLQSLHQIINPQLQLLGVVLNRTHGSSLTAWEQDLWTDMLENAKDHWRLPVHAFETSIRQTTEVREGETEFSPPAPGSELHSLFSRLVAEIGSARDLSPDGRLCRPKCDTRFCRLWTAAHRLTSGFGVGSLRLTGSAWAAGRQGTS
jgi:cellulose biosynthesis protein BcsQ